MHVFNLFYFFEFLLVYRNQLPVVHKSRFGCLLSFRFDFDITRPEKRETNRIIICQVGITIRPKIVLIAHESLTLQNNTSLEDICIFVYISIFRD